MNSTDKPHNPLLNSGAIMSASLLLNLVKVSVQKYKGRDKEGHKDKLVCLHDHFDACWVPHR